MRSAPNMVSQTRTLRQPSKCVDSISPWISPLIGIAGLLGFQWLDGHRDPGVRQLVPCVSAVRVAAQKIDETVVHAFLHPKPCVRLYMRKKKSRQPRSINGSVGLFP